MSNHRISVDIDEEDHKFLKMHCAKMGVTIRQFVSNAVINTLEEWEDSVLFSESYNDNEGNNYVLVDHQGVLHAL